MNLGGKTVANRAVNVLERKKIDGKWTTTAVDARLLAKPKLTLKENYQGKFIISWYEGTKKKYQTVQAPDLASAKSGAAFKVWQLEGKAKGATVPDLENNRLTVAAASTGFLDEMKLSRRGGTYDLFEQTLREFQKWSSSTYIDEITRLDLLKYKAWIEAKGLSPRTSSNKMMRINQFIRATLGQEPGKGLVTVKDAKYVDEIVETYTPEELERFFTQCTYHQKVLFTTFLQSGCRMKELMYLYWEDIDFTRCILKVRAKPEFGFTTKTHEEREIPIPTELAKELESLKNKKSRLVFPTRTGKPNNKWWYMLKRLAKNAGVNCGHCKTCLDPKKKECEHWYLHKFRATCATTWLRSGFDIKTVQYLLGHKDIESTMRYLASQKNDLLRDRIDKVWPAFSAAAGK